MSDGQFSEKETACRRDEVIRRMANTQPQPKAKVSYRPKNKKTSASDRAAGKGRGP